MVIQFSFFASEERSRVAAGSQGKRGGGGTRMGGAGAAAPVRGHRNGRVLGGQSWGNGVTPSTGTHRAPSGKPPRAPAPSPVPNWELPGWAGGRGAAPTAGGSWAARASEGGLCSLSAGHVAMWEHSIYSPAALSAHTRLDNSWEPWNLPKNSAGELAA